MLSHKKHFFVYFVKEIKSFKKSGPLPLRALYIIRILNSILTCAGNQCREANIGEMWFLLAAPVSTQAAAFCINWRILRELFRHPVNMALQWSRQDVNNVTTSVLKVLLHSVRLDSTDSEHLSNNNKRWLTSLYLILNSGWEQIHVIWKYEWKIQFQI